MTTPRPTEDELIARSFAPLAGPGGLGLLDDAALLSPGPGRDLVLTVDAVVSGVHFLESDPPGAVGHKALAVNLSDLAAKGAVPTGFLLSLALPEHWDPAWVDGFSQGLGEEAAAGGCPLLGGDTVRTPGPLTISVTALGEVPAGRMVRRTTARPGDRIAVSGSIGDAALGLALQLGPDARWVGRLSAEQRGFLVDRYRHPRARLALAPVLLAHARAAMDVSDGLAGDLAKMMRASGTTAVVESSAIPLSAAARHALGADAMLFDRIVTGGDDYEILCCVPEDQLAAFVDRAAAAGVPVSPIGRVVQGDGLPIFRDPGGEKRYERGSFTHF